MKSLIRIGKFREIQSQGLKLFLSHSLCRELMLKSWWCSSVYRWPESLFSLLLSASPTCPGGDGGAVRHQLSTAAPKSPTPELESTTLFIFPSQRVQNSKTDTIIPGSRIYPSRCFNSWITTKFCPWTSPFSLVKYPTCSQTCRYLGRQQGKAFPSSW